MFKKKLLWSVILVVLASPRVGLAQDAEPLPDAGDAASGEEAKTLDAVSVTASFIESGAKSAMKMDLDVLDTPFSVSSYGSSFMQAIETTNVADLYNYMVGVKKAGNTGYDMTLRGFKAGGDDRNTIMVDGLPGLTGRFGSPPTIGVDHVEVVKGPMSVLYGQIQPGGFVNLISKKPKFKNESTFEFRTSSYMGDKLDLGDANGSSLAFDTTGHVDEEGRVLYRLVGEYNDRDGFRDFTGETGKYLAPSISWNITQSTFVTVQGEYRKTRMSLDQGLVAPDNDVDLIAPITTRYQEPGDFREEDGTAFNILATHIFANDWEWNTAIRSVDYSSSQKEFSSRSIAADMHTLNRRARHLVTSRTYNYLDSNLTGSFETGRVSHKVLLGINAGRDIVEEDRRKFFNSGACPGPMCLSIDIYEPLYGMVPDFDSLPDANPSTPELLTHRRFDSDSRAFYVSDLVSLGDHWKVSLAARSFSDETQLTELRQPNVPVQVKRTKKSLLPSAGLMYQPNSKWTIYSSYSESYVPADPSDQDVNGENPFEPVSGKQYEIGAKTEGLLDGRLSSTLALYRIEQDNALSSFSCARGVCYNQIGSARSDGAEFEINFRPAERWQLIFGYAYNDAKVMSSLDPVEVNARLANTARNSANIWSRYDFDNGFGVGIGTVYTGERPAVVPNSNDPRPLSLPAYTTVDLGFYYTTGRYAWNMKIGNLFDEKYYESAGLTGPIQIAPGAPRNLTLSLRATF